MNNNNEWAKTLLVAYRFLPRFCKAIDKQIKELGYGSNYVSSSSYSFCDINYVADRIIKLSDKKVDYINLKICVERALKGLNKNLSKILILKYIYQMSTNEITNLLSMNIRTYFRKVIKAITEFKSKLSEIGYNYENFVELISEDNWIKDLYLQVTKNDTFEANEFCKVKILNFKFAI